jgi:hypothetical protein
MTISGEATQPESPLDRVTTQTIGSLAWDGLDFGASCVSMHQISVDAGSPVGKALEAEPG